MIKNIAEPHSIYLHIPFCRHRCNYCDFNTYAGMGDRIPFYVEALCREIELVAQEAPDKIPVHTVFFGGGTPSLLPPDSISRIMEQIGRHFDLLPDNEVSLEANPGTISLQKLEQYRESGINRLSFGVQSAHHQDLEILERQHTFPDVINAVKWARQAGFSNLSLDLIFGLPFQSLDRWKFTVDMALILNPEHLSLYSLTIEPGTRLHARAQRGLIDYPDEDLSADMYEYAMEKLEQEGYQQYEISNWARNIELDGKLRCIHNLQYWLDRPYLGFGAGAHGYANGFRTANVLGIPEYIQRLSEGVSSGFPFSPANLETKEIDLHTEMQESMMVGLRLTEKGVSNLSFQKRFHQPIEEVFGGKIDWLVKVGLLEWIGKNKENLRLTKRGRMLGNQVFMQFVGD